MPKNFPQLDGQGRLYTDSIANAANIDGITNAINTIDYAHHEIHSGSHFYIQGYVELNTDGVLRMKMVTPDTGKWVHFRFEITSSGICGTTLDEGASGGMTGGTPVTPINNNRNSTQTSVLTLTSGVAAASDYVARIESDKWGAGGKFIASGGGTSRENELILKQNTTYLRTFTSEADANIIQFKATWYEHTNI